MTRRRTASEAELIRRMDGWSNVATGLGIEGKDASVQTSFGRRGEPLTRDTIDALYEQDPIFARIVDAPAEHATRRWVEIGGGDELHGFGQDVIEGLDALQIQDRFYDALRLARLDGGAVIVLGIDDGTTDPSEPLNMDGIKAFKHAHVVSRYDAFPSEIDYDPLSPTYLRASQWRFSSGSTAEAAGGTVHASRVLVFKGIQTTKLGEIARQGWGLPVAERVYDSVREFGSTFAYAIGALKNLYQGVLTIDGLNALLASDKGNAVLIRRLGAIRLMASALNLVLLDKGETYDQRSITLTGFADMMVRSMDKLSAAANMPLSVLFGQSPTGLSTDDTGGRKNFYDGIAVTQRREVREPLRYTITVLCRSKTGPTGGRMPDRWRLIFRPLEEPTETDVATNRLQNASADEKLVMNQIISPDEARSRLASDPSSPYKLEAGAPAPVDPELRVVQ